jgi:nucleoside-diphosphate-sugar epimerase
MRYFLTGATGFVGNAVAHQLLEQGHQVNAIIRDPQKAVELKKLSANVYLGDITDKESMRAAMRGVDGVYHIAAWYKIGAHKNRDQGEKVNIQGSRNVFELMKELRIPKGVYTSTLAINSNTHDKLVDETYHFTGKHISEYDRTKAAAHDLAKNFIAEGLSLVIVMPGIIYGPGDTSTLRTNITDFLKNRLPMLPTKTAMCWAHVEDIAKGHILAMEKGKFGETYIIAGECETLQNAFKLASQITGKQAPFSIPYQLVSAMAAVAKPFDALLPETYTSEGLRVIAGATYIGDNSKAKRELGYEPRSFRQGWEETIRHEMSLLGR